MQVGIKVQVGIISKTNKYAGWNKALQVGIIGILLLYIKVSHENLQILIKVRVGKFLRFNKVCCTFIRETKVGILGVYIFTTYSI